MNEQEFKTFLEFGKRIDSVNDKKVDVLNLPFIFVKEEFQQIAENDIIEATKKALKYLKIDYNKLNNNELKGIFLYLYDELLTTKGIIYNLEQKFLSSNPDPLMIAAGQSKLAPFNNLMTIYYLANEDLTKMEEISLMPYSKLLDIQAMKNVQNQVQNRYNELLSKKK